MGNDEAVARIKNVAERLVSSGSATAAQAALACSNCLGFTEAERIFLAQTPSAVEAYIRTQRCSVDEPAS